MPPTSPDDAPSPPVLAHLGSPRGSEEIAVHIPLAAQCCAAKQVTSNRAQPARPAAPQEIRWPITPRLSIALSPCTADFRQGSKSPIVRKLDLPRIEHSYAEPSATHKALAIPYPACDPLAFGRWGAECTA